MESLSTGSTILELFGQSCNVGKYQLNGGQM